MSSHVRRIYLPEIRVPGKRLGRHIVQDERSHDYQAARAPKIVSVVHRSAGLPLNQADVGSCTGEALTAAGNATPNLKPDAKPRTQDDAYAVYHEETVLEGQPWPPNDPGGSGLEVCKAAKKLGWIRSYRHAFGIDHALHALVLRPVIFGIAWYEGFDTPDQDGQITPTGRIRGYHEICALRIITEHHLVGFVQSWGDAYGVPDPEMGLDKAGAFYMTYDTLDHLLSQQGDATVPYFA